MYKTKGFKLQKVLQISRSFCSEKMRNKLCGKRRPLEKIDYNWSTIKQTTDIVKNFVKVVEINCNLANLSQSKKQWNVIVTKNKVW